MHLETLREVLASNAKILTHTVSKGLYLEVDEVRPAIDYIYQNEDRKGENNPQTFIIRTGLNLLRVIRHISNISDKDLDLLRQAEIKKVEMGLAHNSAADITASQFLTKLGRERREQLHSIFLDGFTHDNLINTSATNDLVQRMSAGHKWAVNHPGEKPKDTDPTTHTIIFGHTDTEWDATKNPEEFIVFALTHYCDRIFQAAFIDDPDKEIRQLATTKDIFVDAITAMVRLRRAQGVTFGNLTDMYHLPRNQGGVGWGSDERQAAYDAVID